MEAVQMFTSENTSIKQIARTFTQVEFAPGTRILDWGGGKYDLAKEHMEAKGCPMGVYDKFNRGVVENNAVLTAFDRDKADVVTVNNVLNVIAEPEVRMQLLEESKRYLKPDGVAYFIVYEGDGSGAGRQTGKNQFQLNLKTKDYIPEIEQVYQYVQRDGKFIRGSDYPLPPFPHLRKNVNKVHEPLLRGQTHNREDEGVSMDKDKMCEYGGALKTLKGSIVQRSKHGVGKEIGGQVYVHRNYALDVVPEDVYQKAFALMRKQCPDFDFNCCMYDKRNNILRFDAALDFDFSREPSPGRMISVDLDTMECRERYSDSIWHHKWLWVKDDYEGFSVQDSWEWSKKWLGVVEGPASGRSDIWEDQIAAIENDVSSIVSEKTSRCSLNVLIAEASTMNATKKEVDSIEKTFIRDCLDESR